MKSIIRKLFLNRSLTNNRVKAKINEHYLYNLLFTGKITLKEYLQVLKIVSKDVKHSH